MASVRELRDYLEKASEGTQFASFNYTSPEEYSVLIKCKVAEGQPADYYNNYSKEWISKFSSFTNTAWIVRNCYPSFKRIVFRKTYCCHRSAQNKAKKSTARNMYCKAKIDFKTKFINQYTVRNDIYLLKGLNMTITVEFEHSHPVRDLASFNMLKSSAETEAQFYEYFAGAHSPATAKSYHELRLIGRHGRDSTELASASCNPGLRHVSYLYLKRWDQNVADVRRIMHRKIAVVEKSGHTVKYNDCPQFVVVLTATMKRAIAEMRLEQVLVDETPMASGLSAIYLYVPTEIGSLPIASVVYEQKDSIFREICFTIKQTIESECNKSFQPKLVLLGELGEKRDALTVMFPGVVVKKNRYILCRELWEWICDDKNVINKPQWHSTMASFKSLIYATSVESGNIIRNKLMSELLEPNLSKMNEIWSRREEWLLDAGGGFSDAPVAFMKECLAQRCRSFSMCAMVDVITDILERQYKNIILAQEDGKVIGEYTKMLPQTQLNTGPGALTKIGENEYFLQCKTNQRRFYNLNTDTMFCDCATGVKGGVCEHLCGVLNVMNNDFVKLSSLPEDVRNMFLKLVDDDVVMKSEHEEVEADLEEADEDDESLSSKTNEDFRLEIKTEVEEDPLDSSRVGEAGGGSTGVDMTLEYEAAMRHVNEEFRRLNRLFRDNPNRYNLETMRRLARELAKIRSVESVDVSGVVVTVNRTDS